MPLLFTSQVFGLHSNNSHEFYKSCWFWNQDICECTSCDLFHLSYFGGIRLGYTCMVAPKRVSGTLRMVAVSCLWKPIKVLFSW